MFLSIYDIVNIVLTGPVVGALQILYSCCTSVIIVSKLCRFRHIFRVSLPKLLSACFVQTAKGRDGELRLYYYTNGICFPTSIFSWLVLVEIFHIFISLQLCSITQGYGYYPAALCCYHCCETAITCKHISNLFFC